MTIPHISIRTHASIDNLTRAQRLKDAAVDQMYRFEIGCRAVTVRDVSDQLTVTGRFMSHCWGCSIQLWARNKHGKIQAAAESTVVIDDQRGAGIDSRIKQFRTGELLWTHTAEPVNQRRIEPELATYVAASGETIYQLREEFEFDRRDNITHLWVLTCPGHDVTALRFPDLADAVAYITTNVPGANK
jgi:hypothetical protein